MLMDRHSARRRCYCATYVALVALILTNSVSAFAQTGSMLYVPLLQSSSAGELGLALSNPTLTDTTVVLTARSYTGAALPEMTSRIRSRGTCPLHLKKLNAQ